MKVSREVTMKADRIEIGDRIKVKFVGEKHTATAIRQDPDGTLFLLDDCLDEAQPMNEDGGTDGGYEESDLRDYLRCKASELPDKLRRKMVPFENGDYLTLLTIEEACGYDTGFNSCEGQIPWMKDRRHRIVTRKGEEYEYWWLRGVVSASAFASVYLSGIAHGDGAGYARGVRPAFKISNL